MGFPGGSEVKASACNAGDLASIPVLGRFPRRRKWQPTPVFLLGESHGWRSLVGYSPRGRKELDMTEWLHFLSFYSSFWRSGNPLHCSCLENPMDRGAQQPTVHGVTKSRTWLSTQTWNLLKSEKEIETGSSDVKVQAGTRVKRHTRTGTRTEELRRFWVGVMVL